MCKHSDSSGKEDEKSRIPKTNHPKLVLVKGKNASKTGIHYLSIQRSFLEFCEQEAFQGKGDQLNVSKICTSKHISYQLLGQLHRTINTFFR